MPFPFTAILPAWIRRSLGRLLAVPLCNFLKIRPLFSLYVGVLLPT